MLSECSAANSYSVYNKYNRLFKHKRIYHLIDGRLVTEAKFCVSEITSIRCRKWNFMLFFDSLPHIMGSRPSNVQLTAKRRLPRESQGNSESNRRGERLTFFTHRVLRGYKISLFWTVCWCKMAYPSLNIRTMLFKLVYFKVIEVSSRGIIST